jgi:hypothetical protein
VAARFNVVLLEGEDGKLLFHDRHRNFYLTSKMRIIAPVRLPTAVIHEVWKLAVRDYRRRIN